MCAWAISSSGVLSPALIQSRGFGWPQPDITYRLNTEPPDQTASGPRH